MTLRLLALFAVLSLVACAQNPSQRNTVRICDDQGCAERSKSHVAFEEADGIADESAAPRILALKAAAKEQPGAAYDLGLRYFRADGVRQDSYQALVWMRRAAEAGDLDAQKALGSFYLLGLEEMGPDPQEAEKWLSIAVSRGDEASRPLLAQASAAKQSEQAYYRWKTEWRDVYLRYWYAGYRYRGHWQHHQWHWR